MGAPTRPRSSTSFVARSPRGTAGSGSWHAALRRGEGPGFSSGIDDARGDESGSCRHVQPHAPVASAEDPPLPCTRVAPGAVRHRLHAVGQGSETVSPLHQKPEVQESRRRTQGTSSSPFPQVLEAARLKAQLPVSYADAFALSTAIRKSWGQVLKCAFSARGA
jgi:hypothetical protein